MKKTLYSIAIVVATALFTLTLTGCPGNDDPGSNNGDQNQAPTANAGTAQTVTLANNLTITLDGSASSDSDGTITKYSWECTQYTKATGVTNPYTLTEITALISGNNTATATATVNLRKAGDYTFSLTVTDNENEASIASNVAVKVKVFEANQQVSITVPQFTLPSSTLNFTPSYQPVDGLQDFFTQEYINSTIRYTLKDTSGIEYDNGTVNANANPLFNGTPWPPSAIVQNFYLGDSTTPIASQEIIAWVNGGQFVEIYDSSDAEQDYPYEDSYTFESLVLTLKKEVAEIGESTPPQYETVTKYVTVSFPLSALFGETLNLTPTYTPANGWGDFAESEITYTISDGTNNNLGNIINASSYNDMDSIEFTLTLTQGSNTVSQSFIGSVVNTSGLKFAGLFADNVDWVDISIVPPINITISKQVEKE